ncbi:hypothetical protein [Mycobacterium sp. Marseille-P9652]|uniref:hypothetical protein n=1 Tax=Mycobacterium sp. Marseille-P9652 TaxID=2654950 RepID=UPI0012E77049|nr:hypothetical protein [Mycobacterium sp. Marseille-P9652]
MRNTELDEWSLLLRETLQNSIDARLDHRRAIDFRVGLNSATSYQRTALSHDVFGYDIPKELEALATVLKRRELPLLIIADSGTRGLGGPTRADTVTQDRTDFRDFFLNVGREEAKRYQGGTFGLGRGILFEISEAATIVVFTRTTAEGKPVVRLMGMSLSATYDRAGHRYTGRHWWGVDSDGGQPRPVTGRPAEQIAGRLGLDAVPPDSTGTAILVVAPRIPQNDDDSVRLLEPIDEMIRAAVQFGWPLMIGRHGRRAVRFTFEHGGEYWEPGPPDAPESPVRHFVEAYRIAEAADPPGSPSSWRYQDIQFRAGRSEPKPLGALAFRHLPPVTGQPPEEDDGSGIPPASIALMRNPRMVVRYLPVAKHPAGSSTVGVFIVDDHFDRQFAESEPVAHDDWIPAKIASVKNQFNPVKQALDKIKAAVKNSWIIDVIPSGPDSGPDGLAPIIGDLLGGLVADTPGFSGQPGKKASKPPPTSSPKNTRALVMTPQLRAGDSGALLAVFPVKVERVNAGSSVTLRAEAKVVLDRGVEKEEDRPADAPAPLVAGWENLNGQLLDDRARLTVDSSIKELRLLVTQPLDTVITVEVEASEFIG